MHIANMPSLCLLLQDGMRDMVNEKATKLETVGWQEYKLAGH